MTPNEQIALCESFECDHGDWEDCWAAAKYHLRNVQERIARAQAINLRGQPERYNWAQQNINSGHDQAVHAFRRILNEPALSEGASSGSGGKDE